MHFMAGLFVLLGMIVLFLASEIVDNLFVAGLLSRICRPHALRWMHRGVAGMLIGTTLILAGLVLSHAG